MQILYILALLLSGTGFIIAYRIFTHKTVNTPLACPMGGNCDAVVHSQYGKTFGIENALLGMIDYTLIFLGVLVIYIFNFKIFGQYLEFYLMLYTICGALFSWYLMGIMKFKLKEKCTWCIGSWLISTALAITFIVNYMLIR